MMSLIPLKSDYCVALEQCLNDALQVITVFKEDMTMEECLAKAKHCLKDCSECLAASESGSFNRGKMMQTCIKSCSSCSVEFDKFDLEVCRKFAHSCRGCVEELKLVLA